MTMQATAASSFPKMISSVATSSVIQSVGSLRSTFLTSPEVLPSDCSVSASLPSSSSSVADAGILCRNSAIGDFYCSTASLASRHPVAAADGCGDGASCSHPLMSTVGLQSFFGAGCSNSFTGTPHRISATTPAGLQQASAHLIATGGEGSATPAAESSYLGAFGTSTAMMPPGSDGLHQDPLQPMIYRRPFTGAKPPYSYISLITMAIQVL